MWSKRDLNTFVGNAVSRVQTCNLCKDYNTSAPQLTSLKGNVAVLRREDASCHMTKLGGVLSWLCINCRKSTETALLAM